MNEGMELAFHGGIAAIGAGLAAVGAGIGRGPGPDGAQRHL